MKVRTGFVSNSSSSSFIVVFPHEPTSAEDLHEMLFGKGHLIIDAYSHDVCSHVFIRNIWEDVITQQEQPERWTEQLSYEIETLQREVKYWSEAKDAHAPTRAKQYRDELDVVMQATNANDGSKIYVFTYDECDFMRYGEQFNHPDKQVKTIELRHG